MSSQAYTTYLITGGTGFIGSYLAVTLLEKDHRCRVVLADSNPDRRRVAGFKDRFTANQERVTFVQCDLANFAHVLALFDRHEPTSIFHLGALLSAGADANPTQGFDVDLLGARHVFEATRLYCQHKKQPPVRVLFPSTIASFGSHLPPEQAPPDGRVANESVQMPTTMYGLAKVACERLGEWYQSRKPDPWIDFRAVRFPSVIGAARGPGGTTVYSTLMVQLPLLGKAYEAFVPEDLRLDVIYVKDAVRSLIGLHDADAAKLKRRVYNIAGLRGADGKPLAAADIRDAVVAAGATGAITFKPNQALVDTVRGFGILDDQAARQDWGWEPHWKDLHEVVADFKKELSEFPDRLKALELY